MTVALLAAAVTFAGGIWLLVHTIWPPPPRLENALARLHATGPLPTSRHRDPTPDGVVGWLGRRTLDRLGDGMFANEKLGRDLAVTGRTVELHAGYCVASAIGFAAAGPVLWLVAASAGAATPAFLPLLLLGVGATCGFAVPVLHLRILAKQARADFCHALGAYLDVLVLLLAANHGPEGAMREAAIAGNGPAFAALRRATTHAQYSGAVWDALDSLGEQIGVSELCEVAAAGSLAGERGAAVRRSLVAKARSLRTASLSAAEATARSRSQAMFGPILLMGCGFIVFLLFPLLTNLQIG